MNFKKIVLRECGSIFFKQVDKKMPFPEDLMVRYFPIINKKTNQIPRKNRGLL
jgi:hypothetical protein